MMIFVFQAEVKNSKNTENLHKITAGDQLVMVFLSNFCNKSLFS